jgi:type VI secretion system protein ImpH
VLSLCGLGLPGTRDRLHEAGAGVADESLAYYAPALRERPASAQWFARVVADYFGVACRVEQFVGQWFVLPPHERTMLGASNCLLGQSSFCGERVWDRQSRIRLLLGPLRSDRFAQLLPGGAASKSLARLFHLMVGVSFDCEVRLILDRRDVAPAALGGGGPAARLGWQGWCGTAKRTSDADDVAYLIQAGASA